ncbi:MAG: 4-hydroxy-tetrahydrodipicolinate reductase [Deltaproteobacteria bacterium]|nr:4-hydroxy-tetrahydrodipicolinate reductase [Deltaproteobacteria bacterium]
MTKIIVMGAAGRMGSQIIANIPAFKDLKLVGAIESAGNAALGQEVGGVKITDSLDKIVGQADVVIDFTSPAITVSNLEMIAKHQKAAVLGTTGHSPEQKKSIEALAKKIPIVMASNMSVGMNVMWKLIQDAAKALGSGFDIEVVEMHHRLKKDAPSGTAMTTAEVLAHATGRNLAKDAVYHREGLIGERKPNEIGIQTLRGGDVVGDHTVYFAGTGEMLTVTHRATSRDTFAQGALRAAAWLVGQKAHLYSMKDVLGL